ncbi:cytochrome P450 [Richelia sinica FACHB-800]|uniref:Cytochrome P450 n=1 Tax=Richelia sinica FACHB-800 TaxID=1357546 RepID=A0A975T3V9_9NOST|nr:cytochrome P450 [Richelia sinica]MBD2665880.1 cytochrome P450 [Richelia sinica FACHB-800]QXE21652.1 cytochrome P450 [Richelia sinica FACHB-800]
MQLPPGPSIPKFLQLIKWIFNPLQLMETSAKENGDCFTLWLTNKQPIVFVSNPQAIQDIFTSSLQQLDARGSSQLLQPLVGQNSLLLLSGASHQSQRRLLTPPFYGDRMKAYGEIITDITREVISKWQFNQPFAVRSAMQEISLKVILKAVFGINTGEKFSKLESLLYAILDLSSSPWRSAISFLPGLQVDLGKWSPWGIFLNKRQQIYELLFAEIQERKNHPDPSRHDILSLMMSARDENGEPMTDIELRDELMTLLVAGHETTASALAWALYWIHRLPNVKEKLISELDTLGEKPDSNEVFRLPYLSAVCQETLRIYPIGMITLPRIVQSSFKVMDYELPAGSLLVACIYLTHRRPDLYPQPQEFKPERFLEKQYSPYEYLPFGGGNRRCLGMSFALFEMKLVLATILSQLDLTLVDHVPVVPQRRGVTLGPTDTKWLIATGKRPVKSIA